MPREAKALSSTSTAAKALSPSPFPDVAPPASRVLRHAVAVDPPKAPILLANADYYGTLAATRSLGSRQVPVYVASDRVLTASRWSRHAAQTLNCPSVYDGHRFVDWLVALGEREPGIVLYPTSDETTYLYALRKEELSRHFLMYQPEVDTILHVLDKKRLYTTAREVGLGVPDTWFPRTDADVAKIAADNAMPLLVKPRTQALSKTHSKGVIVTERADLVPKYRRFVQASHFGQALLDRLPDAADAMIQRFVPDAANEIYVLAAFIDRDGGLFASRSGVKIFQRPRRLGVGLCFESVELPAEVIEASRGLARATGYYGLFQLEFIKAGDRYLLIDFNPRFYNQLAFDMARGLPIPQMVHAAACGAREHLADLVARADAQPAPEGLVFCNEFGLNFVLAAQHIAGRVSKEEIRHWRKWHADHRGSLIDPTKSRDDPLPAVVDMLDQLRGYVRHPRAFLRSIVFGAPSG